MYKFSRGASEALGAPWAWAVDALRVIHRRGLTARNPQGDGPHVSATLSVMPMSGLSRQAAVSRLGTVRPRSGAGGGVRFLTDHMKEILCQRKKEKDLHGNPRGRGGLNLNLPNPSAS